MRDPFDQRAKKKGEHQVQWIISSPSSRKKKRKSIIITSKVRVRGITNRAIDLSPPPPLYI